MRRQSNSDTWRLLSCQSAANALAQIPRRALIGALKTDATAADAFKTAQPSSNGETTLLKLESTVCVPGFNIGIKE